MVVFLVNRPVCVRTWVSQGLQLRVDYCEKRKNWMKVVNIRCGRVWLITYKVN